MDDQTRKVSAWHIDEVYLQSIWSRVDIYNKGIERATNLTYDKQLSIYKECWTLLKNVYYDFSPYMKKTFREYMPVMKNLQAFFWAKPPTDQKRYDQWVVMFKKATEELDECKFELLKAMAHQKTLLTFTIQYSMEDKIKRVMADE